MAKASWSIRDTGGSSEWKWLLEVVRRKHADQGREAEASPSDPTTSCKDAKNSDFEHNFQPIVNVDLSSYKTEYI